MNHHLEQACESIDASVFSGDVLESPENIKALEEYIGRWTRAIAERKARTEDNLPDDYEVN